MPWNSRPPRSRGDASQYANRGANAAGSFDTKPSSGSPRGVPPMKSGKVGGYTSRTKFAGSSTNPGNAGSAGGKGGLGSAKGA